MKKMYSFFLSIVVSLFFFSSSLFATIPSGNLDTHFPLDEGTITTENTADPANDGDLYTSSSVVWASGPVKNALDLGGDTYVEFIQTNLNSDFTVAAWVKLDAGIDHDDVLFGSGSSSGYAHFNNNGNFIFTGGNGLVSNFSVAADTWVHLALVRTGSTVKMFKNGNMHTSTNGYSSILKISEIGRNSYSGDGELGGAIDDFYIYKRALSGTEVRSLYDIGSPAFAFTDSFSTSTLESGWSWVRENSSYWSLTDYSGYMNIKTTTTSIHETSNNTRNILLRDDPPACAPYWEIRTKIDDLSLTTDDQEGGLIIYMDDDNFVKLTAIQQYGSARVGLAYEKNGTFYGYRVTPSTFPSPIELRLVKEGDEYTGYYHDGTDWVEVYSYTESSFTNLEVGLISQGVAGIDVKYDFFEMD